MKGGVVGVGHVTYSLTLIRPKCIFLFFMRIETKVSLSSIMVIGKLVTIMKVNLKCGTLEEMVTNSLYCWQRNLNSPSL